MNGLTLRFGFSLRVGLLVAGLTAVLPFLASCGQSSSRHTEGVATGKKIKVTATTTMVADLARAVGGEHVDVQGLMGPGVDPHLYKATASDVTRLQHADVVLYSGLMLEGKLEEIFSRMARSGKRVHAVTDAIPREALLKPAQAGDHYDPHVWFEVPLWSKCVDTVVKSLSEAQPSNAAHFSARGAEVKARLDELHQWALQRVAELPPDRRILVTSHDAFSYFGRAYGFDVVGLQGISTVTESSLADLTKLVDFVKQKKVRAIFIESSVPPNTIRRISEDAGVKIGGELFSDAMGTPGHIEDGYDVGTYEGMIKHNVNTIVKALK